MPAPSFKARPMAKPRDIVEAFYADPFDKRMRGPDGEWSTLGTMVRLYGELRRLLNREAKDAREYIDRNA